MADYNKLTAFTPKDYLPVDDPEKLVVGAELDAEFDAIETAMYTKENKEEKGVADGYAPLDDQARVPRINLPAEVDYTDTAATHTVGKATEQETLSIATAAVTPNCNLSNVFYVALTENITINAPTNPRSGQVINIILKQDATGGRTVTFNSIFTFSGGGEPTATATANAVDMVSCQYDVTNTKWRCSYMTNFG
jgi:hypothetical protein